MQYSEILTTWNSFQKISSRIISSIPSKVIKDDENSKKTTFKEACQEIQDHIDRMRASNLIFTETASDDVKSMVNHLTNTFVNEAISGMRSMANVYSYALPEQPFV